MRPRHLRLFHSLRPAALRALLLFSTAALVCGSAARAQGETGFLRGKGRYDLVLGYTADTYDEFYVNNRKVAMPGVGEVDRVGVNLYGAYGLTDDIDLILNTAYIESESDGAAGAPDEGDLQDAYLSMKWRVLEHRWSWGTGSVALLPGVKLPLSDYEINAITAIGDGQVDLRGRVVGQIHLERGFYAAIETGYDRRNGAPDDEIPVHITLGVPIGERLVVSPFYSSVDSLGGTNIGPPGTNFFPGNEEDYTLVGVGAYARLTERFGLSASWRTTTDGRNTGDIQGISFGLVYRGN